MKTLLKVFLTFNVLRYTSGRIIRTFLLRNAGRGAMMRTRSCDLSRLFSTQVVCHSRESGNLQTRCAHVAAPYRAFFQLKLFVIPRKREPPVTRFKEYESGKLYVSIKSIS